MIEDEQTSRRTLLAIRAEAQDIDRIALHQKTAAQLACRSGNPEILGINVGDRLARGANQVMMRTGIRFDTQRAMMQAHFVKDSALDEYDGCSCRP